MWFDYLIQKSLEWNKTAMHFFLVNFLSVVMLHFYVKKKKKRELLHPLYLEWAMHLFQQLYSHFLKLLCYHFIIISFWLLILTCVYQDEDEATIEEATDVIQGKPYHGKDWCLVRGRDCLYLWSDSAALELSNGSNGWFRFILDGKLATMYSSGSPEGGSDSSGEEIYSW